jgi:serine/threonine protein kinase
MILDGILPAQNAMPTASYDLAGERPGTRIGPYKLLQQIGEGGFGIVYMAEQEMPVRRLVALKIIKPGMDTAQVIARFESERQALALMDHPNIAKVLDAGASESGRPYFVMEMVKGVPVTEFCDKSHMLAEQRLKLFLDICQAIQHAHNKGVIHRDIKPSNVMVTLHGVPVVKVIDFGVAKATAQKLTERTLFTAYGQMIGTPAYMSPEQAEISCLDIDTRSDIYSLGVLLYELLTGTTPLEGERLREAGYAEMQRLIREQEPPRPSTRLSSLGDSATILAGNRGSDVKRLIHFLRTDLDWIVMKAMDKDRNRRYSSPGDFAADLERYLRHEAILARRPSTAYRLKKFARRNRAAILTMAAGLITLLAITGQVLIQHAISERTSDSHVVDLAGRQRMLSQRLVKLILLLGKTSDAPQRHRLLTEVRQDLELWGSAHQGMQKGDPKLGLPGRNSAPIVELFAEIDPHQADIHAAVRKVLTAYDESATAPKLEAELKGPVQAILTHEGLFLEGMNRIVQQFAADADARAQTIRSIALVVLAATLVVLVLTGLLYLSSAGPALLYNHAYMFTCVWWPERRRGFAEAAALLVDGIFGN